MVPRHRVNELRAFGLAVRARREALGISQEDLADRAGLHRTYLGSVERGERNLAIKNIYAISRALGTTPSKLFAETDGLLDPPTRGG